jgi:hypothetical protein
MYISVIKILSMGTHKHTHTYTDTHLQTEMCAIEITLLVYLSLV